MTTASPSKSLLGEIISWDIYGQEIPVADIRSAIASEGLGDPDTLCPDLKTKSGFSRAIKELKDDRLVEQVKKDGKFITFQLTQPVNDGNKIDHVFESILCLDLETGVVDCTQNPKLAAEASALVSHAMDHRNAGDLNRLIQRLFKSNADLFAINSKGVAYFVPDEHRAFVGKIERVLAATGGTLQRYAVPSGDAKANASVKDSVNRGMERMLQDLEDAAEAWNEKTTEATRKRALDRFDAITFKADAYAEYLDDKQDQLREKLKAAKKRLIWKSVMEVGDDQPDGEPAESQE